MASTHHRSRIQLPEAANQEPLVFALGLTLGFPNSFTEKDIIKSMRLNPQYFYFFIRSRGWKQLVSEFC